MELLPSKTPHAWKAPKLLESSKHQREETWKAPKRHSWTAPKRHSWTAPNDIPDSSKTPKKTLPENPGEETPG
ncbi:hypothetical protein DUI87_31692 [Hirundo rustica rustica]|uniref:Uncharacterized protein n=1 Tax=Hirundo rustica rustica TaxID=333673 RepID=A0A3M0ITR7_HIRRU|nr:hypothetical protein DUI87_31692 [Hirundo rustica rustica]